MTVILDPEDPSKVLFQEGLLVNVHSEVVCAERGGACVIHRPTEHAMRGWPLHWRGDRGIFERTCSHGIGHYDPDQEDYWRSTNQEFQMIHGCDGCCSAVRD